nr:Protein of unknown function DUF229 domain containing protein [Haemonchus contortus]
MCLFPNKDSEIIEGNFRELPTNSSFECDIIETECNREGYNETEHYLHMQIYENETLKSQTSSLPNVYMIVIDSTSTFMVKRSLPKTLQFLKNNLGAVQMNFLNKVGDNSRPNGFPLLFGKSIEKVDRVGRTPEEPDWNNTEICNEWLDEYPYILEEYKKKGYKSLAAVDYSKGIMYYQFCKGLRRKEADHLYRPFDIQMHKKSYTEKLLGATCGESHLYMLQFLEMFMNAYTGIPKISLVWLTGLAHDTVYSLYHTDDHFLKFFTNNQKNLENSFLFFFGDHGPRYSGIHNVRLGRYENRNPFFLMALPKRIQNTAVHEELRAKSMQLMTHFDIHATLNDILHYQPHLKYSDTTERRMLSISKGSSLLRKWQGPRNCQTLPIPFDYCICQYEKKNVTNELIRRVLGFFVADELNRTLERMGYAEKCLKQKYKRAIDIEELQVGVNTLYTVYVELQPSNGLFSAQVFSTSSGLQLSSGFTRWGVYGSMGVCVPDPASTLCHCKGEP